MKDKILEEGAQAFAQSLRVPGGRTSFDFAVQAHREWFTQALARGLSWNQIIELLRRAGVCRDDGRPLSRGHLSAVFSRQKAKPPAGMGVTQSAQLPIVSAAKPAHATTPTATEHHSVGAERVATESAPKNLNANAQIKSFMARAVKQRKYNE